MEMMPNAHKRIAYALISGEVLACKQKSPRRTAIAQKRLAKLTLSYGQGQVRVIHQPFFLIVFWLSVITGELAIDRQLLL